MTDYAVGRRAYGFCERCAFRWPIGDLKAETYKGIDKNNRVCPDCWDAENPQVFVGDYQFDDPQSLKRPAPDLGLASVNAIPANVGVYGLGQPLALGSVVAGDWTNEITLSDLKAISDPGIGDGRQVIAVVDTATTNLHPLKSTRNIDPAVNITFTAYIKGLSGLSGPGVDSDQFIMRCQDFSGANVFTQVFFYNGTYAGLGFSQGAYVDLGYTISQAANGFVLASMTVNLGGGTSPVIFYIGHRPVALGTATYTGDGTPKFCYIADPVVTNP